MLWFPFLKVKVLQRGCSCFWAHVFNLFLCCFCMAPENNLRGGGVGVCCWSGCRPLHKFLMTSHFLNETLRQTVCFLSWVKFIQIWENWTWTCQTCLSNMRVVMCTGEGCQETDLMTYAKSASLFGNDAPAFVSLHTQAWPNLWERCVRVCLSVVLHCAVSRGRLEEEEEQEQQKMNGLQIFFQACVVKLDLSSRVQTVSVVAGCR